MIYAPIIIPTLNRSSHFIRLIDSLKRNNWARYTDVYVSVDFPPSEKYRKGWKLICDYLDNGDFSEFASLTVFKQKENLGASKNSRILINYVKEHYDRWIRTNDDAEFAPNFLEYMDKCLDAFEDDPDVVAVTGYSYPVDWDVDLEATCFKQNFCASMWGTGFWKQKRTKMEEYIRPGTMLADLDRVIQNKTYKRMIDASLRDYIPVAVLPIRRINRMMYSLSDIGIRAYLAVADKYFISPVISKVRDHGFDGSGFYCQTISDNLNGNTAGTYNYSQQPIDESDTFELVLDTKQNDKENHDRLNRFDVRTPAEMRRTRLYLWLMTHFGVWAGKACAIMLFPFDFGLRAFRKIWRTIKK